jgi:iron uptake system component EfeO
VDNWLNRTEAALRTAQRPDGSWTPVSRLDREQREKIDGAVSGLTERLAPVAAITEPRRVS